MSKNNSPTCCYCCHIKVGTFMLAVLHLIGGMMIIIGSSLLLTNTIEPKQFIPEKYTMFDEDGFGDHTYVYKRSTLWVGLGNGIFVTLIASLAMFAVIKNRAGFLLPLFIVELFNFLCTVVFIGSQMFYWPKIKQDIRNWAVLDQSVKDWLLNIDDRWLAVIIFGSLALVLLIRSYLISMVYRCYKHITTQALHQRRDPEISFVSDYNPGNGPIYKPPKYEDIQKVPLVSDMDVVDTKPPPYAE